MPQTRQVPAVLELVGRHYPGQGPGAPHCPSVPDVALPIFVQALLKIGYPRFTRARKYGNAKSQFYQVPFHY